MANAESANSNAGVKARSLAEIIKAGSGQEATDAEVAIMMAYMAGLSCGRAALGNAIRANFAAHSYGRYRGVERRAMDAPLAGTIIDLGNPSPITDEAEEILGFDYAI